MFGHRVADDRADSTVQAEHIDVYESDLMREEAPDGRACGDVGLQHIRQDLDVFRVGQDVRAGSLADQRIPLSRHKKTTK